MSKKLIYLVVSETPVEGAVSSLDPDDIESVYHDGDRVSFKNDAPDEALAAAVKVARRDTTPESAEDGTRTIRSCEVSLFWPSKPPCDVYESDSDEDVDDGPWHRDPGMSSSPLRTCIRCKGMGFIKEQTGRCWGCVQENTSGGCGCVKTYTKKCTACAPVEE